MFTEATKKAISSVLPTYETYLKKMTGQAWQALPLKGTTRLEVRLRKKASSGSIRPTIMLSIEETPSGSFEVKEALLDDQGVAKTKEVKNISMETLQDPAKALAGLLSLVPTKKKVKLRGKEQKALIKAAQRTTESRIDEAAWSDMKPGSVVMMATRDQDWWYKITGEPLKNGNYPALQVVHYHGDKKPKKAVKKTVDKGSLQMLKVVTAADLPPGVKARFDLVEAVLAEIATLEEAAALPVGTVRERKKGTYVKTKAGWQYQPKRKGSKGKKGRTPLDKLKAGMKYPTVSYKDKADKGDEPGKKDKPPKKGKPHTFKKGTKLPPKDQPKDQEDKGTVKKQDKPKIKTKSDFFQKKADAKKQFSLASLPDPPEKKNKLSKLRNALDKIRKAVDKHLLSKV